MSQDTKIYRAGVIPYIIEENGSISMLFMKPSSPKYGGDDWQIGKGKIDPGETAKEAALREGNEELGLFSGNVSHIHDLGNFLGRTQIFLAKIKDKNMFGDPHFETKEVEWLTLHEFLNTGRDIHKPVVKAAHRWISETS